MSSELYAIGRILKSSGLKGDVIVQPLTDFPERFRALEKVWVETDEGKKINLRVESTAFQGRAVRLRFEGVGRKEAADKLRGKVLYVSKDAVVRIPEGTYFIHDIIGSSVKNERGEKIGTLTEVWKLPANDVYVVRDARREFLLPAIRSVIQKIDTKKQEIQIKMIEGF